MPDDRIPRRTLAGLLFGTLAVGGGLAGALRMLFRTPDRDAREVVLAAQGVLRQRLPQGVDVRFAPVKDTRTEPRGNDLYVVTGLARNQDTPRRAGDLRLLVRHASPGRRAVGLGESRNRAASVEGHASQNWRGLA